MPPSRGPSNTTCASWNVNMLQSVQLTPSFCRGDATSGGDLVDMSHDVVIALGTEPGTKGKEKGPKVPCSKDKVQNHTLLRPLLWSQCQSSQAPVLEIECNVITSNGSSGTQLGIPLLKSSANDPSLDSPHSPISTHSTPLTATERVGAESDSLPGSHVSKDGEDSEATSCCESMSPSKCAPKSMLFISSALCNDSFARRRERNSLLERRRGECETKSRYQERFAPLRPTDCSQIESLQRRSQESVGKSHEASLSTVAVEPPPWAVPAGGEARLEPVCESLGVQDPVDLTSRSYYRVGRSPTSDVQLLHATSSRRHALLFHHPNGSCYVVDCGSAHGTYVNGVRVPSAGSAVSVIPHRIRRGALVRFGGPGAPCFVLKSFSVGFRNLVQDLGVDCGAFLPSEPSTSALPRFPSLRKGPCVEKDVDGGRYGLRRVVSKESDEVTLHTSDSVKSEAALVQLNTRLNALGGDSRLPAEGRNLARRASLQLCRAVCLRQQHVLLKRPRTLRDGVSEERDDKKLRIEDASCANGITDAILSPMSTPALVSPFSSKVLVTPDMQQVPPPPLLTLVPTPQQIRETLSLAIEADVGFKDFFLPSGSKEGGRCREIPARKVRKVRFADGAPQLFFPASVTPDELSSDEGDEPVFHVPPTPPTTPRSLLVGV